MKLQPIVKSPVTYRCLKEKDWKEMSMQVEYKRASARLKERMNEMKMNMPLLAVMKTESTGDVPYFIEIERAIIIINSKCFI